MASKHLIMLVLVGLMGFLAVAPANAAHLGPDSASNLGDLQVTKNVRVVDFAFMPRSGTITVGDSIHWRNYGRVAHTTDSVDLLWDAELAPGESFTYTFDTAGFTTISATSIRV